MELDYPHIIASTHRVIHMTHRVTYVTRYEGLSKSSESPQMATAMKFEEKKPHWKDVEGTLRVQLGIDPKKTVMIVSVEPITGDASFI